MILRMNKFFLVLPSFSAEKLEFDRHVLSARAKTPFTPYAMTQRNFFSREYRCQK